MDEGFYVWFPVPHPRTGLLFHSMPESAAGWTAAGYSPKSFYFVNLFPSGTKFGPGSGTSHPMHFLPRPRVGLKSDSFCVMNFMTNSPVYPSVQKEIHFQREFPPPGLAGKSCTGQFSFYLLLHFPSVSHPLPIKTKNPQNWLFHPWWNFIYYFSVKFLPSNLFFPLIHFWPPNSNFSQISY
jgi:hypothetical protein